MITKEQIKKWKEQYADVHLVEFEDGKKAYFGRPTRKQYKLIMSKARQLGPVGMTEALIKNCLLGGDVDEAMFLDDKNTKYLAEFGSVVDTVLGTTQAQVKKL